MKEQKNSTAMDLYHSIRDQASEVYARYVLSQCDKDLNVLTKKGLGAKMVKWLKVCVLAEVVRKLNQAIEVANLE